jgi:hypothetical protein
LTAKYLGITIQNNLKWDKHINTITAKANQSLGFIKRNLKVHSPAIKALVRPKLEYCNTVVYDFVKEYESVPYAAHLKWGPI